MAEKVPIKDKVLLTVEEAAAYSNIGICRIRQMLKSPTCMFSVRVGNSKQLVKRKEFEKYVLNADEL